jgi:hypothetical protein
MAINSFLPGGQSSTNVDYGFDNSMFGRIASLDSFSASGLMSLFASQPQYVVKAESGDIAFHSMLELGAEESSNLPEEPIEKGSFADYNRTINPITINCRLASQGSPSTLQSMIERLQELKTGTEKLTFITPMMTYENFMLESFDYRKDEHTGHNVLVVDVRLKEIREIEGQKTTSSVTEPDPPPVTADASADGSCVSAEDCGEVQASYPSSSESSSADSESSGRRTSILHDTIGKL